MNGAIFRIGLLALLLVLTSCDFINPSSQEMVEELSPSSPVASTSTSSPSPTATPTSTATPESTGTPVLPSPTPSSTMTQTPTPTLVLIPTSTPSPMPPPPSPTTTTFTPTPTETTQATYRFVPVGSAVADTSQSCPGCPKAPGYINGYVFDAGGNPMAGVRLVCYNEWYRSPVIGSKGGGAYDFPVIQAVTTWYVVILDESDQTISPEAPIYFDPLEACWYRLDWQQVN